MKTNRQITYKHCTRLRIRLVFCWALQVVFVRWLPTRYSGFSSVSSWEKIFTQKSPFIRSIYGYSANGYRPKRSSTESACHRHSSLAVGSYGRVSFSGGKSGCGDISNMNNGLFSRKNSFSSKKCLNKNELQTTKNSLLAFSQSAGVYQFYYQFFVKST